MKKKNNVEAQTGMTANHENAIYSDFSELFERYEKQQILRNEAQKRWDKEHSPEHHSIYAVFGADVVKQACIILESIINSHVPQNKREQMVALIHVQMEFARSAGAISMIGDDEWDGIVENGAQGHK